MSNTPQQDRLILDLRSFQPDKPGYTVRSIYFYRGGVKIGERLTLNIPPEDYARHWELEGPR